MANLEPVPLFISGDAGCWRKAVHLYNLRLKGGPSNKKYIKFSTESTNEHGPRDHARELMATAVGSYQRLTQKKGPFATKLLGICAILHQYSRAIDVFIQCDPTIASLVWGSIRVLLEIVNDEEQASKIAGEGIIEIVCHAGRWEKVSAISGLLSSAALQEALVALYVTVLDFLVSSTQWLRRGTLERLGSSIFHSKSSKFKLKLNKLRTTAEFVDKELQTQTAYKGLGSLEEIKLNTYVVMHKIDKVLEQFQHLSDHTSQLQLGNEQLISSAHESSSSAIVFLSKLQSPLPVLITDTILNQMQGILDLNKIKQWLILSINDQSLSVPYVDGTCGWILQHPSFMEWNISEESPILWVQGHLGCGKSVMAGYLQEYLMSRGSKNLFYRFQRSASTTQSTPTTFASSLILQLLERLAGSPLDPHLHEQLQNLAAQFPLGPQYCPFNMVWAIATSLFQNSKLNFILLIDAMDECVFGGSFLPEASVFLDNLNRLVRNTGTKAIIFTRPEPMFTGAAKSCLSIFMTHDLLLADILTFAEKQYGKLGLPSSEMNTVLQLVSSSSHGSFRWAELFLHHLGQSLRVTDLQTRMRAMPPSVSELYKQSLLNAAKRFTRDELECQKSLLLAIFQAQRPLRTAEIADAFSLRHDRADIIISNLCRPLASTYGGFFHLSHPSVREFFELCLEENDNSLGISFSDSHGVLAEKCVLYLLNDKYADLNGIGSYLLANYAEKPRVSCDAQPAMDTFFDYAYRFWDYHLIRTKEPSNTLLRLVHTFLSSLQFTYWSEYSRRDCGQLVRVNGAFCSLVSWHKGLSVEDQKLIDLDGYFQHSYSLLSTSLESYDMDGVLPWLARMTTGEFYFIVSMPQKARIIREQVLTGLQSLLGARHYLTLHAKSHVAWVRLNSGNMRESRRMYDEVVNIQQDVLGEQSSYFLETLTYKGQSEYYMADFMHAVITWTKSSAGLLGLLGPDSWQYLSAQLWYARGVAYMGKLGLALRILQTVARKRCELFGPGDSFFNAVQVNVGEIQLLLRQHEEAIATLEDVVKWRRAAFSISNIFRLDAEITLAIAYQAAGMSQAALIVVQEIENGVSNLRSEFQRYCQIAHLKGLLLAERGSLDEAIYLLQATVIQAKEDQNNRALLWIRLDLATMLRKRDREFDKAEASIHFDNIVKDTNGDYEAEFPDEPDHPTMLAAAEKALRLVRAGKLAEARQGLDSQHLEWRRPSDFWLWVGGSFSKDILQMTEASAVNAYG